MVEQTGTPHLTTTEMWGYLFGDLKGFLVTFTGRQSERPKARPNELDDHEQRSWAYPQQAEKVAEYLRRQSDSGRDAYFGVHLFARPGNRRKDNAATMVQALWVDTDGAELPEGYPEPNVRVESSPGREHLYWLLSEPLPTEEATKLNQRIAYGMGADIGKWGLGTVLRAPGTLNYKRREPTAVSARLVSQKPYDPDYLDGALPAAEEVLPRARRHREEKRNGSSPRHAGLSAGEPPVRLSPADLEAWLGTRTVVADDGGVDRSRTLHWIACGVARGLRHAGISEAESHRIVADAVEERDFALGYRKYTDRDDRAERYAELADEGIAEAARDVNVPGGNSTNGSGGSGSPGGSTRAGAAGSFTLTDYGNAERLVGRHGEDLRYCHAWKKWLVWDGQRWRVDDTGEVERRAKETVRSTYAEAAAEPDADARKALAAHAKRSESSGKLDAMIALAESEPGVPVRHNELDADPWSFNVANGTIDLRSGNLRPHVRDDLITKLAPVVYDPTARAPAWDTFLEEILPSYRMRAYLKRLIGYALTGKIAEHILPICHGTGANGKSTLLNTVLEMAGEYGLQAADDLLVVKSNAHPTEQADLFGRRYVTNMETEDGKRLAESRVKQLTGGDRVRARRMREDFWEFSPTHTLFLATNHKPEVRGTDHAIWRRLRLIPFTVTIPQERQDKHLDEKLRAELPGILRWAVEGCLEWQRHGLGEPDEVMAATKIYREEMDVLAAFLSDRCVVHERASALATPLYHEYREWCEETGERVESQKKFGSRLGERGFESRRRTSGDGKGQTEYIGVGLLSPDPSPDPPRSEPSSGTQRAYLSNNGGNGGVEPSPELRGVKDRDSMVHRQNPAKESGKTPDKHSIGEGSEPRSDISSSFLPREGLTRKKVHYPSPFTPSDDEDSLQGDEKEDKETAPGNTDEGVAGGSVEETAHHDHAAKGAPSTEADDDHLSDLKERIRRRHDERRRERQDGGGE